MFANDFVQRIVVVVGIAHDIAIDLRKHQGRSLTRCPSSESTTVVATAEGSSQPLPDNDNSFDWVETVAPVFDLEGATLEEYLLWYSRESGYRLQWVDADSEDKAKTLTLRGSIAGRTVAESLEFVHEIAPGFELRIEDGTVWATVR